MSRGEIVYPPSPPPFFFEAARAMNGCAVWGRAGRDPFLHVSRSLFIFHPFFRHRPDPWSAGSRLVDQRSTSGSGLTR